MHAAIEFRNWRLPLQLGHYGPDEPIPDYHEIDMILTVDPTLVFIETDSMDAIFDYDPLRDAILALAGERHFETQEFFLSRLAGLISAEPAIAEAVITLRKAPIWDGSGNAGVTLELGIADLTALRSDQRAANEVRGRDDQHQ
jgi:dihydroneopterin aldolase